jgi:hypothetical protein
MASSPLIMPGRGGTIGGQGDPLWGVKPFVPAVICRFTSELGPIRFESLTFRKRRKLHNAFVNHFRLANEHNCRIELLTQPTGGGL